MVLNSKIQSSVFISLKSFSTTSKLALFSGYKLNKNSKEAAFLNKFLDRSTRKKKFYFDNTVSTPLLVNKGTTKCLNHRVSHRISVLNKLFMKHITDIMATGSSCSDLTDYSIEITRVCLSIDYRILNVYWLSRGSLIDPGIETKLLEAGSLMRNELTRLNILGNVPKIVFHKDKRQLELSLIDKLLSRADYPEINDDDIKNEDVSSITLHAMPTNIFGLDREKIIHKVKSDMRNRKTN